MAEKKALYGQALDDALAKGVRSVYENEKLRSLLGGARDKFLSVYDPVAAKITQAGAYQDPFFKKSLLKGLTPETPAADRETVKSITEDLIPYQKNPDYTALERLQLHFDAARAELGLLGETLFGDARRAGEKLNSGKTFEELTEEEKSGVRYFGLDIATLGIPVAKPIQAGKALATGPYNIMADIVTPNRFRTSAGGPTKTDDMFKYDQNAPKDIREVEVKSNAEELDEYMDKNIKKPTLEQVKDIANKSMKEKGYTDIYGDPKYVQFAAEKISVADIPKTTYGDPSKLEKIIDGKTYVNIGNRPVLKEDAILQTKSYTETYKGVKGDTQRQRTSKYYNLKDREKSLITQKSRVADDITGEDRVLIGGIPYPYDQTKTVAGSDGRKYRVLKPEFSNQAIKSEKVNEINNGLSDFLKTNPEYKQVTESRMASKGTWNTLTPALNKHFNTDYVTETWQKYFKDNFGFSTDKPRVNSITKQEDYATAVSNSSNGKYTKSDLMKGPSEFKFMNFLRTTFPTLGEDPSKFNKALPFNLLDKEGTQIYDMYQNFKVMDQKRKKVQDLVQPFLKKMFPGDTRNSQIHLAHTFEKGQMNPNFSTFDIQDFEEFIGKGGDTDFLYLDIGKTNMTQSSLESKGQAVAKKLRKDNLTLEEKVKLFQDQLDIDETMTAQGMEGSLGGQLGQRDTLANKLQLLSDKYLQNNGKRPIEQKQINKAIEILTEGGTEMKSGGIVNAADVQYAVGGGFFSKMFGKPAPYMKEEIAKTDIFSPTIKQKATLEALGPEATAVNPGQVFYSNMELSLSKANSPVKFDSEKEFYDYINAAGIGRDEVGDARIGPYISAKAKAGEPILSEDIIKITNESPLNQLTTDGYGFRSEKINVAKRDEIEGYDSAAITKGDPQYKSPKYSGTGLMPGYLPNTYRERVLQIDSDKFRGDPGSLADPAARSHSFGDNYTIAWGRSTDRPAIINQGEMVDKATGTIINPLAVTDTKKLQEIEGKIQGLVDDPLTNIKEDDFEGISQAVKALVDKSGGRLPYDKAKKAVDAQIIQKNKQLKKLQSQFVEEEKRLKSIVDMKPQNITMTFIDEIQSDIAQAATRKSRELAAKLEVMAEQGMTFEAMQEGVNRDLLQFFADNQSVARPVGATKLELMPQYEELLTFQKQFGEMGKKRPYELTTQDFAMYDNFKVRQAEIIDSMTEEINDKLMNVLYPDVPLKDRGAWSDAVLKQHLYEAAHRLFVEKDPRAPTHLGVASGDIVGQRAYSQQGSTATDIAERTTDKQNRMDRYKDALRADINTTESIGKSNLPGVGTHEFYGGPNSKAWNEEAGAVGGHYTSDIERSMRKYAEDNNSKMIIANVAVSDSRGGTVYNIINQETAEIMGTGDTYRQAENIANQLVDEDGGRYKIKKTTEKKFDTEPVFSIPLTKEMLQLNKIYK